MGVHGAPQGASVTRAGGTSRRGSKWTWNVISSPVFVLEHSTCPTISSHMLNTWGSMRCSRSLLLSFIRDGGHGRFWISKEVTSVELTVWLP